MFESLANAALIAKINVDLPTFRSKKMIPFCYTEKISRDPTWTHYDDEPDTSGPPKVSWTELHVVVRIPKLATYSEAKAACESEGMELPWGRTVIDPSEERLQMLKLLAISQFGESLRSYNYEGLVNKMFWAKTYVFRNYEGLIYPDVFFMTPSGDAFNYHRFIYRDDSPPKVNPNWQIELVCEKDYPRIRHAVERTELPDCLRRQDY